MLENNWKRGIAKKKRGQIGFPVMHRNKTNTKRNTKQQYNPVNFQGYTSSDKKLSRYRSMAKTIRKRTTKTQPLS